jgi:dipeptidyl aminopeptidase/acylaminoacyl peptidase
MSRKATLVVLIGAALGGAAILYGLLWGQAYRPEDILAGYQPHAEHSPIGIEYPLDGTVFPPEMVPPVFRWKDSVAAVRVWLVSIPRADGGPGLRFLTRWPHWSPGPADWEVLKRESRERDTEVVILGVGRGRSPRILSRGQMSFRTSQDAVGAPLFFREVNLPFLDADQDPSRIRWRFGPIDTPHPPPVVLKKMRVCTNCHSFSRDGTLLAMDVDYANSKASYVITRIQKEMALTLSDIITWSDADHSEDTFGLLSQISPDGRYVVSTIKDKSIFIPMPPLAFSQLFFPVKGILCVYDRQNRTFRALPGADDPNFVQSNPTWSPDGRYIVFARARAMDLRSTRGQGLTGITQSDGRRLVADGKPFPFDLYRIPFNGGAGGTPEPLAGASHNGMSNYFARYSPDGRWIVFCRARSYMLLQPDSELYIIPAEGGTARRLRGNTARMNSWHSWSPNGKWLVFSSKAYSDYTQLCLTHIDETGESTPAVLLSHLTAPDRAANIPEFVNTTPDAIAHIRASFLKER